MVMYEKLAQQHAHMLLIRSILHLHAWGTNTSIVCYMNVQH